MAETDSWEADDFEPEEPTQKGGPLTVKDRWEGEDEEDEVKDNWDDEEEAENKQEPEKIEQKVPDKKKLQEKIKAKEKLSKNKQEEIKKRLEAPEEEEPVNLSPEEQMSEKLRLKKLQEDADLELAKEAFGVVSITGIDAMNPSSREDFVEFGKLLKEKITQYEKSLYYPTLLETLVRDICISLELDDLKKVSNSLTVLCSEKQKQEKQNKAKKKKKGVVPGGGLKANMKNDLADYGGVDDEYGREFEDFM
ncbi:eukaryotic translation initiation factor 3 subunit J isoform X2 [Ranitomeya variabilis]|uniref:eukaryotic translation initiation factor 3 subunit J isoform X2 n=1 Tax=Ranitomeya variabilis TaxID=490064 RepID=UPI004055FB6C